MPELSQVLRQRLASRGIAGDHPDADTLTAFAERLLPPAERSQVLGHIAVCGQCREVVALSLPEPVESGIPALAAPRRIWRWPALGLAGSLAMLAVVATVIIELPRKPATFQDARQSPASPNPTEQDSLNTAPKAAQPESAAGTNTAATEPRAAASRTAESGGLSASGTISGNAISAGREAMAVAAPPPPLPSPVRADAVSSASSGRAVADARLHERDYVNKQMFVGGQANEVAANPADIPAAPLPRLAQNRFPPPLSANTPLAFAGIPPQQDGQVTRSRRLSNPPNNHFGVGLFPNLPALGRKAEAKVEALAKRTVAIPPGALTFSAMEGKAPNAAPEEQLQTTDGTVNGQAKADLDQSSAFSQRALAGNAALSTNVNGAGSAAAWKVSGGNLLKSTDSIAWNAGYGPGDIEFTLVVAHGANVWAGGANAALVHSVNGGTSWERITLGASAAGSITSIEFSGLNVHVKSSSGQEWSSQDGGKTWSAAK